MKRKIWLLSIFCGLLFLLMNSIIEESKVHAQSIEDLSSVVVYMNAETKTIQIDGNSYELWLKKPGQPDYFPYPETDIGTGFFVVKEQSLYLVTAEHVARLLSSKAEIIIKTESNKPFVLKLQDLWNKPNIPEWRTHKEADVAVLSLNPSQQTLEYLSKHFLPFDILVTDEKAPSREVPLAVIGFPLGLGVSEWFSPISQDAKPASGFLRLPRFDNKKMATFYILDKPSVGGFSGAPVFELPGAYSKGGGLVIGGKLRCVGLVHGTLSDNTGGKFAAVVPSIFIVQTILETSK